MLMLILLFELMIDKFVVIFLVYIWIQALINPIQLAD